MDRSATLAIRIFTLALALILAVQVLQPSRNVAFAQTGSLATTKQVINLTTGMGPGGSVSASPGDTLQYILQYGTVGTSTATGLTLTDALQAGQTFAGTTTCSMACSFSGSTVTFGPIANAPPGQVTFDVTVNPGFTGTLTNRFTATATNTTPTTSTSAATTVTVAPTGPSTSTLTLEKQVANVTRVGSEATAVAANPGDTIRYFLQISASAFTGGASAVVVTDTLQPGQTFADRCSVSCSYSTTTNTVSLNVGTISSSPVTVTFDATINSGIPQGTIIQNTATAAGTGTNAATSNTTSVVVGPSATPTPPIYVPPPSCGCVTTPTVCPTACNYFPPYYSGYGTCGYFYSCNGCSTMAYGCVGSAFSSTLTICGVVQTYTAPTTVSGVITINNEAFLLMPSMVVSGGTITVGKAFCFTFTLDQFCRITTMIVSPNVAGAGYICGTVSPFNYGYNPYAGYMPYAGWTPYPGYNPFMQPTTTGPYPMTGTGAGYYGFAGPMIVAGYPFQVSPSTTFPYTISYGNPYCFLQGPTGYITGSLSVVPTAASAVEAPSGTRHAHRAGNF